MTQISTFDTFNDAYMAVLKQLYLTPYNSKPRALSCKEMTPGIFTVRCPNSACVVTADTERNEKIERYTKAEFKLYDQGTNDAQEFAKYAPFWRTVANDDGTVNSAYGKIIWKDKTLNGLTPWEWCVNALKRDPETRQATLLFMRPDHLRVCADVICTSHVQFIIRDSNLHATTVMRSNDVVKGLAYDGPWFISLLERMAYELDTKIGTYTHFAHSLHLYADDLTTAERMIYGK